MQNFSHAHGSKKTVTDWLEFISTSHPKTMDLGLDRIQKVAEKLAVLKPHLSPTTRVIVVGGTNGKGSCVAALEQIYLAAGFSVGAFTSPHLWKINEEIRLNGVMISDQALILAFEAVQEAIDQEGLLTLTLFEYMTLAALFLFKKNNVDLMILEIGMGGRLDAVNIMDGDLAVITSIGLDHQAFLGHTRGEIATQKAGIFRKNHPVICGERCPPKELIEIAQALETDFYLLGRDFEYFESQESQENLKDLFSFESEGVRLSLPIPRIDLNNAATVLMAVKVLQAFLPVARPVSIHHLSEGLRRVFLPGRFQIYRDTRFPDVMQIFDVGHNPQAIAKLSQHLNRFNQSNQRGSLAQFHAVFSMLGDKDIRGSIREIKHQITHWHIASVEKWTSRAATVEQILQGLLDEGVRRDQINFYSSLHEAHAEAIKKIQDKKYPSEGRGDGLLICGSFYTVAAILEPSQATAHP